MPDLDLDRLCLECDFFVCFVFLCFLLLLLDLLLDLLLEEELESELELELLNISKKMNLPSATRSFR